MSNEQSSSTPIYKKEEFIHVLQSYIDKLNSESISFEEGLMLVEFFTKNRLQKETSLSESKEDALNYAFLGYYIKEICKKELKNTQNS